MLRGHMDKYFITACRTHDACYSIAFSEKDRCDTRFKDNLEVLCREKNHSFCDLWVWSAYQVVQHKGDKGYIKRQMKYGCRLN